MSAKRLLHITFCFILIIASAQLPLTAQQLRYNFKNYTPSDGLPSSEVYQVLRDSDNYMWFATDHGICRYNGYEFKAFNLADNSILGICEDYKKRIWAYSFSGRLFYYERGEFKDYQWNDRLVAKIKSSVINAIYIDSLETLHISASGPAYYTISKGGDIKNNFHIDKVAQCKSFQISSSDFFTAVEGYPINLNQSLVQWYTSTQISIYHLNKQEVKIVIPHTVQSERCRVKKFADGTTFFYSKDCIVKVASDNKYIFHKTSYSIDDIVFFNGYYYLATGNGLFIKNSDGTIIDEYFKGIHITSIEADYEGGLWISSLTNGVFYIPPPANSSFSKEKRDYQSKI
ncbi:MAG: two-component regulator propeller domain-containing protein [Lacibacter sp.]